MDNKAHKLRVIEELKKAGMTAYGTIKMETEKLHNIIHDDEHIGGVVYGRTTGDKIGSAMLIATNKRVIFLDVKPFYTTFDEVAYDVVAGVSDTHAGPFAGIVLHTRVRDYGLRFVNKKCAAQFVEFIERHIELHANDNPKDVRNEVWKSIEREKRLVNPDDNQLQLIKSLNTATLSTVDREGNAHGAIIHYVYSNDQFYFLTKSDTDKSKDIAYHGQVALTIHVQNSLQTIQISGLADTEKDKNIVAEIFREISTPKQYTEGTHFPPIVSIKKGDYVVIRVTPTSLHYHDYSKSSW